MELTRILHTNGHATTSLEAHRQPNNVTKTLYGDTSAKRINMVNEETRERAVFNLEPKLTFSELLQLAVARIGNKRTPSYSYCIALQKNRAKVFSLADLRNDDDVLLMVKLPTPMPFFSRSHMRFHGQSFDQPQHTKPNRNPGKGDTEFSLVVEGEVAQKDKNKHRNEMARKSHFTTEGRDHGTISGQNFESGSGFLTNYDRTGKRLRQDDDQCGKTSPSKKQKIEEKVISDPLNPAQLPKEYLPIYDYFFAPKKSSQGKIASFIVLALSESSVMSVHDIKQEALNEGVLDENFKSWNITGAIRADIAKFQRDSYFVHSSAGIGLSPSGAAVLQQISDIRACIEWMKQAIFTHGGIVTPSSLLNHTSRGDKEKPNLTKTEEIRKEAHVTPLSVKTAGMNSVINAKQKKQVHDTTHEQSVQVTTSGSSQKDTFV